MGIDWGLTMAKRKDGDKRLVSVTYCFCHGCGAILTLRESDKYRLQRGTAKLPLCDCDAARKTGNSLWEPMYSTEVEPAIAVSGLVKVTKEKKNV